MMIGALGNIPFQTSSDQTLLLSGLKWDSGMTYAEHKRHNETGLLEYVGKDPDEISFDIKLSAFLGVNPTIMMDRLRTLHTGRHAVKFALGTMPIPGLWVLTKMKCEMEHFHKDGTLLSVDIGVTLREYVEQVILPVISNKISFTDRMVAGTSYTPIAPVSTTPQPSPDASRKPVVPATTKPVAVSPAPVTKPAVAAAVSNLVSTAQNVAKAASTIATTITNKVTNTVANLNIVQTIKKAFSQPASAAASTAPKPTVVKGSSGSSYASIN